MERADSSPNWDLDSDEIASVTSDDLHANRPNRWDGPTSSWRTLTAEERHLWRSMQQLHNQDLALHLYDAHALTRAARTARRRANRADGAGDTDWAPPKAWTAWPLAEREVPREALVKEHDDDDDRFTFRKAEPVLPSSTLHEELAATVLRLAKERFLKRKRQPSPQAPAAVAVVAAEDQTDEGEAASLPSSPPLSHDVDPSDAAPKPQADDDAEGSSSQNVDGEQPPKRAKRLESPADDEPVVSANDDVSYELLRPCVDHLIAKLDRTLTILHNARVAGVSELSDSSTDSDSDSQTSRRRPRPSPTSPSPVIDSAPSSPSDSSGPRRRGRPRKLRVPRVGETDHEFRVRIAREAHRRIPSVPSSADEAFDQWLRGGDETGSQSEGSEAAAAAETSGGETSGSRGSSATRGEDAGDGDSDGDGDGSTVEAKLRRWGLRDWSDVVGAAALAGFPESVVKRTAKRCARLFGEGIVVRRLEEMPATGATACPTTEFRYRPEPIRPNTPTGLATSGSSAATGPGSDSSTDDGNDDSEEDEDGDDDEDTRFTLQQRRLASLASTPSPRPGRRRSSAGASGASGSRSRSRSRSSAGLVYCPVASCERAAAGFERRANLRRHMQLVHPGLPAAAVAATATAADAAADAADADADSDDEVFGAVHVDGFLRPIVVERGWRAADARPRALRGRRASAVRDGDREGKGRRGGGRSASGGADDDEGSHGVRATDEDSC